MTTQPIRLDAADRRADLLARLELDLMTWSDRTAIAHTEPEDR